MLDRAEANPRVELDPGVGDKIMLGARYAPKMVEAALHSLALLHVPATDNPSLIERRNEVIRTLVKYFRFHDAHDKRSAHLTITNVYSRISAGLGQRHKIILCEDKETTHGYVPAPKGSLEGALDPIIGQSYDQYGHVPWPKVRTGEIHLNINWLKKPNATPDQIAKLIVHEASHKYAKTMDHLYKSSSMTKGSMKMHLEAAGFDPKNPEELYEMFKKNIVGNSRDFVVPMSKGDNISTSELLKNADSYAWTARRFWKRTQDPIKFGGEY